MVFAALKLISDTILELSLLFFSKDSEGKALNSVRKGSVIYVIGGACSLFSVQRSIHLRAWVDLYRDECRGFNLFCQ
ncbi:YufK family protein [Peribacillus frigoritolerans]|uniref:YufK family protein n=1 Tax=Peribacillus frigoritolerans TaxID=450367 RepID=UPI0021D31692|nr:YufK family protein [Peribacillus frigoritolerans]MCU6601568.1 YufK family protein [Peribacillus frigoritolerans]